MQSPIAARTSSRAPLFLTRRLIALSLLWASGLLLVQALWIPAKAELAQWLLARSWNAARTTGVAQPPWAWADTRAVARLHRPGADAAQIVLAGDSGRVLAFGPGWNELSAVPGRPGTVVISAHRDTHFAWLRDAAAGATLELEGLGGRRRYRLQERHILDVREHALAPEAGEDQLLLVTCWPFDAAEAGGPLRLVLRFLPLEKEALAQPGGSVPQPGAYSGAPS